MTIRTQVKAGRLAANHNEALRVRSTLRAGQGGRLASNHNEALRVRSTVKAGKIILNHNEALRAVAAPAIAMLRQPRTTSRKDDRLELLVVRAGLRAGRGRRRAWGRSR